MSIKQISVFIENKPGHLADFTCMLAENNINIRALSIADTQDYGVLRLILENPDEAEVTIKKNGYVCTVNKVLAVVIEDKPGSLAKVLKVLADSDIEVEYVYAFNTNIENSAYMVFRVNDNVTAKEVLTANGIAVVEN
ncbi:MAG: ACT domain-containing protein [Clostridia bacterium]|nr:ACT domain-containing protein [Clostridia bacterium]